MLTQTLNKQLPIPLYYQLKTIVLEGIKSGKLKPNDRLPSEDEMAERYAVSKATVRQALNDLVVAGLLRREQGRGTFIAEPRLEQGPRELSSFTHEMRTRGLRPSSRVLKQDVIKAEGVLAEKLKLKEGSSIFRLNRLRLADEEPMGIQIAHIPLGLVPNVTHEDFSRQSLYELLERKYGLTPAHAREAHFVMLLGSEDAELLGVAEGSPGLGAERVTFLSSGQPFELTHSVMRGDRYKIVLDLVNTRALIAPQPAARRLRKRPEGYHDV